MANLVNWGALRPIPGLSREITVGPAGIVQALPATARLFSVDVDNVDVYMRMGGATLVGGDVITRAVLLAHDERCRYDRDAKLFAYDRDQVNVAFATEAGNATVEITFYQEIW